MRNLMKFDNLRDFDFVVTFSDIPKFFINIGEIWTTLARNTWHFENEIAKRKCWTKFSFLNFWIRSGALFSAACFWPGLLLWKSGFSWFSPWIPKVQKCINLVDLVKSFHTSIYYLLATFGVDTAENGPLKVCQN